VEDLLAELGQLEEDQTTIEELQALISSLETSLAERDAEISDFQTQIDALNDDISELEGDNAAITERVQQLESLNAALEQTIAERDTELEELQTSVEELTAQQVTNTASIAELETTKNNLLSTIATLETQIELANTTDIEQAAAITTLQEEVSALQTDIYTINQTNAEEVSRLESEITELEGRLAIAEQNQIDNETEIEALETSIATLENQLLTQEQSHTNAITSLEEQLADTNEQLALMEATLELTVAELALEKAERVAEVALLNTEITSLEERVANQASSIATLQLAINALNSENTVLRQNAQLLQDRVIALEAQMETLTSTMLRDFVLNEAEDIVYLGDDDAVLAFAEIEFSNTDAVITTIEIEFVDTPENVNLWEVFESLSLWLDGDKIVDILTDSPDGSLWETTTGARFNSLAIPFNANETSVLHLAADINSEAGSEALGLYEIEVREVEYQGTGDIVTVTDFEGIGEGSGVVFEVDELGGETLNFSLSPNNPDSTTLPVDRNSRSDAFTILSFGMDVEEGPVALSDVYVRLDTANGVVEDIINDVELVIDGKTFRSRNSESIDGDTSAQLYLFEVDQDIVLNQDETVEADVQVEFKSQDGNYDVPQLVSASIDLDTRSLWEAEGYDDLNPATDFFGTVFGKTHTLMVDGLLISDIYTTTSTLGENDTIGQFKIEFEATAFEDDFYFTDNIGTAVSNGIQYRMESAGTDVIESVSTVVTSTANEEQNGVFVIREGETKIVTLQVQITVTQSDFYRLVLEKLFFTNNYDGVTNTQPAVVTDPADLRTDYHSINSSY